MPSSTRIPITMIIPKSEITLMVSPYQMARTNIPQSDIGILSATQNASRIRRNIPSSSRTSAAPKSPFSWSRLMRSLRLFVESSTRTSSTSDRPRLNSSIYSLILSEATRISSLLVVFTVILIARSRSRKTRCAPSSRASLTVATSLRRIIVPSACVITGMSLNPVAK